MSPRRRKSRAARARGACDDLGAAWEGARARRRRGATGARALATERSPSRSAPARREVPPMHSRQLEAELTTFIDAVAAHLRSALASGAEVRFELGAHG